MKSTVGFYFLLIIFLILQTTIFPRLLSTVGNVSGLTFLNGHTLELGLILLVYLALHRDRNGALIWGVLVGVTTTWFGTAWEAAGLASSFALALVFSTLSRHIVLDRWTGVAVSVGCATVLCGVIHLSVGQLFNSLQEPFRAQIMVVLLQAVLNGLAAPVVFEAFRRMDDWIGVDTPARKRRALIDLEM